MVYAYTSHLGRSALQTILRSRLGTRIAVPDLLCPMVYDVISREIEDWWFYKVNADLTIDWSSVDRGRETDLFLAVDYWGHFADVDRANLPAGCAIIYDSVFSMSRLDGLSHPAVWFNSFRKLLPVPDGSLIVSTTPLIVEREYRFPAKSIIEITYGEWWFRTARYTTLATYLPAVFTTPPRWPKFFPMAIDGRDEVMAKLKRDHGIQLPRPWPDILRLGNPLYDRLMFIDVSSDAMPDGSGRIIDAVQKAMQ